MRCFAAGSAAMPMNMDKKTKASLVRDNLRREYGTNLKIAGLKLGCSFLHIS
jgi:hypothetical protein